jgi:hypothetical protein
MVTSTLATAKAHHVAKTAAGMMSKDSSYIALIPVSSFQHLHNITSALTRQLAGRQVIGCFTWLDGG